MSLNKLLPLRLRAWIITFVPVTLVFSIAPGASAGIVKFTKKIDPGALQSQLKSAGYAVDFIECSVDNCTIHMPDSEKKDPMPIVKKYVYVDPFEVRRKTLETMRALYAKWDEGTITSDEKDQLIKLFIGLNLGLLR